MESYNYSTILSDLDELISLYVSSEDDEEKKHIYNQMLFASNIDSKIIRKKELSKYKPKDYNRYLKDTLKAKKLKLLEFNDLTRILCFNLYEELNKYYPIYSSIIISEDFNYNRYLEIMRNFFKDVLPTDLSIFDNSIIDKRLILNRDMLFSSGNVICLDSIGKYYIMIYYCDRLKPLDMATTIHEFGHASTLITSGSYNSKDYLFNEVVSCLYELLFLNYYLNEYGCKYNEEEIFRIFNFSCVEKLKNKLFRGSNIDHNVINMIEALYGEIISVTIYCKYFNDNLLEKIEFIKKNYSKFDCFKILELLGISENDLIDTSYNLNKLVLKR